MPQPEHGMETDKLIAQMQSIMSKMADDSIARHQANNKIAESFMRMADSTIESRDQITNALAKLSAQGEKLSTLYQWAFGAHGQNGINSQVKAHTAAIAQLSRWFFIGLGIFLVLQTFGLVLLGFILDRLPG